MNEEIKTKDTTKKDFWKQIRAIFLISGILAYGTIGASFIFINKISEEKLFEVDLTLIGIAFIIPSIYMFVDLLKLIGGKK